MAEQIDIPLSTIKSRNPALKLSEMEQRVAAIIRRRGREDPVAAADIVAMTGIADRSVRNIVRDLVIEHGLPIGSQCASDKNGFYWISDAMELKAAADRHVRFGIMNIVRGRRLFRYHRDELIGQLEAALD